MQMFLTLLVSHSIISDSPLTFSAIRAYEERREDRQALLRVLTTKPHAAR